MLTLLGSCGAAARRPCAACGFRFAPSTLETQGSIRVYLLRVMTASLHCWQVGKRGSDGTAAAAAGGPLRVKHLPPLRLDLACPPGYPATDPPHAALAAPWLGAAQAAELDAALAELWEQQGPGNPVGFTWANWLAAEALDRIGASGVLVLPAPDGGPGLDPSPAGSAQGLGAASPTRPLPSLAGTGSSSSTANMPGSDRGEAGGGSNGGSGCTASAYGVGSGTASLALERGSQPVGDAGSSSAVSAAGDGGGPASGGEPAVHVPAARGSEPACASHQHAEAGERREGAARGPVATCQPPEMSSTSLRQASSGAGAQHRHRRKGGARACEAASGVAADKAGPDAPAGPRQRPAALQPGRRPGAGTGAAPNADTSARLSQPAGLRIEAPAFSPQGLAVRRPAQSAPRDNRGSANGAAGAPLTERASCGAAASAAHDDAAGDLRPGAAQASGAAAAAQALIPHDSHQAAREKGCGGAAGAAGGAVRSESRDGRGDGSPDSAPAQGLARGTASSESGIGEAAQADGTEDVLLALLRYSAAREYQLWQEVRVLD